MHTFTPRLDILPPPQRSVWPQLASVPPRFVLYGGTAIALRLGHRSSVDFDFFTSAPFSPADLLREMAWLEHAQRVQSEPNTLTVSLHRDGPQEDHPCGALF
jgi:hypothetical protein